MQNKKGFTLIELMIVVAIIAILAMIAVPMYQRYIERSRNSAAQSQLQQLSLAEVAIDTAPEVTSSYVFSTSGTADTNLLASFGFRPDPNVAIYIVEPITNSATGVKPSGFVAFAAHVAANSQVFVYDNINASGVQPFNSANDGTNNPNAAGIAGLTNELEPWIFDSANNAIDKTKGTAPQITKDPVDNNWKVTTAGVAAVMN